MKRIFVIFLLLAMLCGCYDESVPAYEAPQTAESVTQALSEEATTEALLKNALPDGKEMLRLSYDFFSQTKYQIDGVLERYDEDLDIWQACCGKTDCAHADESCYAWFGWEETERYFAVRDGICYCVDSRRDENNGERRKELHFFALDTETGERTSYHRVDADEAESVVLSDAAICEDTAILNYDILTDGKFEKMHYILAFDLKDGSMTSIMERPIVTGEIYDLWGMNEDHIIVAYRHTGGNTSFSTSTQGTMYGGSFIVHVLNNQRWVLLEYPIEEDARWSEQLAEYTADSNLWLCNHSNFYRGTLYYCVDDALWAYDLKTHAKTVAFTCETMVYMSCFDGKIFYQTQENEYFYYDLLSGKTTQFAQGDKNIYFPFAETDEALYCYLIAEDKGVAISLHGQYYRIDKEDFYAENYATARCIQ